MLIDWFTVCAQAFNFVILVWLLKRYLYKPVLSAIDARDQKISGQLKEAADKKNEAEKEREDFQHKNDDFQKERHGLLDKATQEAQAEREKLLGAAHAESEALSAKLKASRETESDSLSRELKTRTQAEVYAIARKTLGDLADASLEEQMTKHFLKQVQGLTEKEKTDLSVAAKSSPATLASAFPVPAEQQKTLQDTLKALLGENAPALEFRVCPELVSGIELDSGGHMIGWNIDDYLTTMKRSLDEVVGKQPAAAKGDSLNV